MVIKFTCPDCLSYYTFNIDHTLVSNLYTHVTIVHFYPDFRFIFNKLEKIKKKMDVDLNHLLDSYEVVPVSLSDPFKSLVVEPTTMELLRFLPIIAFFALLIAAVWRQSNKLPLKTLGEYNDANKQE